MKYRYFFFLLSIILLISSCPLETSFSDLEGINLLSLDEQSFTGWAIDYGLTTPPAFNYMTFNLSGEAGPSAGDTVYRTEIVNLMPNGDFNNNSDASWGITGTATRNTSGGNLDYTIPTAADRLDFDLGSEIADGLVPDASYLIRFQLQSNSSATSFFQYTDPVIIWTVDASNTSNIYNFPDDFADTVDSSFTPDGTTDVFSIGTTGTGGTMDGIIDDFRVTRTDISSCVVLDVPVSSVGRADLISGTYRFTINIKNDPGVTPVTDNRMPAEKICLALTSSEDAAVSSFNAVSYDAGTWASGWTALSVTGHVQIDIDAVTALRLRISPTDTLSGTNGRDVGSLLISAPVLEFSSTGNF